MTAHYHTHHHYGGHRPLEEKIMALTEAVKTLVDQVAATRGAVDSQTALVRGIPQMIADAIAKDRAANPSLTAEDFSALEKLRADLADEKTQVELADALVANPEGGTPAPVPGEPARPLMEA